MDERRFDAIARFLDAIQTRRGTLRGALAGIAGIAFLADPLASEAVSKKKRRGRRRRKQRRRNRCGGGKTRCGGACVDTRTDPRNCGRCLVDCDDDEVCSNGECTADCAGGQTLCNGVCVNTNTDAANCGRCGRACAADQVCVAGDCEQECPAGQTLCDDECIDTDTDPENCGACGRECESGAVCFNGMCGCTVCDDDDECQFTSVQAAIDAALPDSTITICKGSYAGSIAIAKNLTLRGAGAEETTLEPTQFGSVVTVASGATVSVRAVTITGGTGTVFNDEFIAGGGVFNQGDLTLADVVVTGNFAERGGGIANAVNATMTLDNTVVSKNRAITGLPESTFGGGILNLFSANLVIRNGSAIVNNEALNSAGIHNNGKLEMYDSRVADNDAGVAGGGIIIDQGTATLNNTVVSGNEAARGQGGGILNLGFDLVLENGSEIKQNKAGTNGGGIVNENIGTVTATDSTIQGNDADQDGGGIYNSGGQITLTQTSVRGNEAGERGGGVFQSGPGAFGRTPTVTLEGTSIFDNDAGEGGGIFNTQGGVVTLDNQSAVVDNNPDNCVGTNACGA